MWLMVNRLTNSIVIFKNAIDKEITVNEGCQQKINSWLGFFNKYIGNLLLGKKHI
jgi:hypothetical protein